MIPPLAPRRRRRNPEKAQPSIQCPSCGGWISTVMDTRPSHLGPRRRRECVTCGSRYSTLEVIDQEKSVEPNIS